VNNHKFCYRDFLNVDVVKASRPASTESLATFAVDLNARGIELTDTLLPHDVHRCSRVSVSNFIRTLGPVPLNKAIADQFAHPTTHETDYLWLTAV
jgi:hypothetical protein